jgi:hypothetical protein
MTIKTHAALAISFCYATCIVICCNSNALPLIGFLYGPTSEIDAQHQKRSVEAMLAPLAATRHDGNAWPWENIDIFEVVLDQYNDVAYRDHRALVLRDAGVIAAFFALILTLNPNYGVVSRLKFSLLSLPLYAAPGMVGQITFLRTTPIEILLLKAWGVRRGMACIGYCSIRSLLSGPENALLTGSTLIHDIRVVVAAGLLVFLLLGYMPSVREVRRKSDY